VLHAHAANTLEPAVLLHTFLPVDAVERLRGADARVDVHSDGAGSPTVSVRVLVDGHSLTWQLPVAPLVAALPGQAGDDGRVVLLAVVDAEPAANFWAEPVDCERLTAELALPVGEVVDALRGRLAPWLADDVDLLLHDDAHDHAADQSPEQLLASAVLAHYHREFDAEQTTTRLVRGLAYGPPEFQATLGQLMSVALGTAVSATGPAAVSAVLAETGPFEDEVIRLLSDVPGAPAGAVGVGEVLLAGADRDETVRAAVSVVARLARTAFGADLADDELLQRLDMVDDAALATLAGLWVRLAVAAVDGPDGDEATVREVAHEVRAAGRPGATWLRRVASTLAEQTQEVAGRLVHRVGAPLELVRTAMLAESENSDDAPLVHACVQLARFTRGRAAVAAASWAEVPLSAAVQSVGAALADGLAASTGVELLAGLLEPDLDAAEAVDAFVCATAQVLVQLEPAQGAESFGENVSGALNALPPGARAPRWLLVGCLRGAHAHDPAAPDLAPVLIAEPSADVDRAAERAGVRGVLRDGLTCLGAVVEGFGPAANVTPEEMFAFVLPAALAEHDLLRRAR